MMKPRKATPHKVGPRNLVRPFPEAIPGRGNDWTVTACVEIDRKTDHMARTMNVPMGDTVAESNARAVEIARVAWSAASIADYIPEAPAPLVEAVDDARMHLLTDASGVDLRHGLTVNPRDVTGELRQLLDGDLRVEALNLCLKQVGTGTESRVRNMLKRTATPASAAVGDALDAACESIATSEDPYVSKATRAAVVAALRSLLEHTPPPPPPLGKPEPGKGEEGGEGESQDDDSEGDSESSGESEGESQDGDGEGSEGESESSGESQDSDGEGSESESEGEPEDEGESDGAGAGQAEGQSGEGEGDPQDGQDSEQGEAEEKSNDSGSAGGAPTMGGESDGDEELTPEELRQLVDEFADREKRRKDDYSGADRSREQRAKNRLNVRARNRAKERRALERDMEYMTSEAASEAASTAFAEMENRRKAFGTQANAHYGLVEKGLAPLTKKYKSWHTQSLHPERIRWGDAQIVKLPLTRHVVRKTLPKTRKATQGYALTNMERFSTDGRIFRVSSGGEGGGAVLIDQSGSMHLRPEEVELMVHAAPSCKVAGYSGGYDSNQNQIRLYADRSRMTEPQNLTPPALGNIIDGPALEWLGQQPHPRIWVSDGMVTGHMEATHYDLLNDAMHKCRKYGIIRVNNPEEALELFCKLNPGSRRAAEKTKELIKQRVGHMQRARYGR